MPFIFNTLPPSSTSKTKQIENPNSFFFKLQRKTNCRDIVLNHQTIQPRTTYTQKRKASFILRGLSNNNNLTSEARFKNPFIVERLREKTIVPVWFDVRTYQKRVSHGQTWFDYKISCLVSIQSKSIMYQTHVQQKLRSRASAFSRINSEFWLLFPKAHIPFIPFMSVCHGCCSRERSQT
jgi:hypothetical protein